MSNSGRFTAFWQKICDKIGPVWMTVCLIFRKIGDVIGFIIKWIFKLRKVFLAIPVVYYAIRIADYNMHNLPEEVGLNLLSTGEFAKMIPLETAVYGPLILTGGCLLLMFFSRRALYPWLISIFTLTVPFLLLLTNIYPA